MKQNKQLIRCLKKKLYGGRGPFSRTVDYIALRAIVFMGCYMWFSAMVANGVSKAMLSRCGMNGVGANTTIKLTRPTVITMVIIITCAAAFFCLLGIVLWIFGVIFLCFQDIKC